MQYTDAHVTRGSPYRLAVFNYTNFYSMASDTRNGCSVRLNAATNGMSGQEIQAGIR